MPLLLIVVVFCFEQHDLGIHGNFFKGMIFEIIL